MVKKILLMMLFMMVILPSQVVGVSDYNVQAFTPEEINKESATLKGEVINPKNRELTIFVNYKKKNETEFTEKSFVSGVTSSTFDLNVYLDDLKPDTTYEYYFRAERENSDDSIDSNIVEFTTMQELGILNIDLTDDFNQLMIILSLIIAVALLYMGLKMISSAILLVTGSFLLFSGFSFVLSFLIFVFGIGLLFYG